MLTILSVLQMRLVVCFGLYSQWDSILVYIGLSPREREKEEK